MTQDPPSGSIESADDEARALHLLDEGNFPAAIAVLHAATTRTPRTERLLAEIHERFGDMLWFHDRGGSSPHYRSAMETLLPRGTRQEFDHAEAVERQEHWTRISEKLLYGTGPDGLRRKEANGLPHPNGRPPAEPPPEPAKPDERMAPIVEAPTVAEETTVPQPEPANPLPLVPPPSLAGEPQIKPQPTAPPEDPRNRGHLKYGHRYRVARSFSDFDGTAWPEGTVLTYQGSNYFPYDEGLTLFTENGAIRLCGLFTEQEKIMGNLETYLVPVAEVTPEQNAEPM